MMSLLQLKPLSFEDKPPSLSFIPFALERETRLIEYIKCLSSFETFFHQYVQDFMTHVTGILYLRVGEAQPY